MKREFTKAKCISNKIKRLESSVSANSKIPSLKEFAFIGKSEEIFISQVIVFMVGMIISLISFFFWEPSLKGFLVNSFIAYLLMITPYFLYIRLTCDVGEIKRHLQIENNKNKLYEEYHKALEAIDMDYLDYEKFTREEVLILMDKAELAGRKKEASSSRSNTTLMAATTAIAVSSTINS